MDRIAASAESLAQIDSFQIQSQYVRIGGVRTHYVTAGTGPPVVLLAGLASSVRASWRRVLPALAESFRVFAVELPGQGDSEVPAREYTFEYGMEALAEFLDALRLEAVNLVGASAGGLVALGTALRYPKRVERLVLIDSVGFGREITWGLRLATLPLVGELAAMPKRWLIMRTLRQNFVDSSCISDDLVEEFYRVRKRPGVNAATLSVLRHGVTLKGIRPSLVLRDQLHRLQAPTLIIWGDKDKVLPLAHAFIGQSSIPNARLHIIRDAGHDPVTEQPMEVASVVKGFLQCSPV